MLLEYDLVQILLDRAYCLSASQNIWSSDYQNNMEAYTNIMLEMLAKSDPLSVVRLNLSGRKLTKIPEALTSQLGVVKPK